MNTLQDTLVAQDDLRGEYIGTVVEIDDPLNQGRVKATIPGIFTTGELPWIGPRCYSPFGMGANFGWFGSPQKGAKLAVIFQDGDVHKPLYTGGWRGPGDTPTEFQDPTAWGFKDTQGNTMVVQGTNMTLTSAQGVVLNFQGMNLIATVPGQANVTASGGINLNTAGTAVVKASGAVNVETAGTINLGSDVTNIATDKDVNITAANNLTATVSNNLTATVSNNATVNVTNDASVTAKDVTLTAQQNATINATNATVSATAVSVDGSASVGIQGGAVTINGSSISIG